VQTQPQFRFYYGWIIVGVTILVLLISAGVRSAPGVFMLPLAQDTGWSRATISFAVSFGLVIFGLIGPFTGWLLDRIGLRTLTVAGLLLVGISMILSSRITQPWQLNALWGFLGGVGTGMVGSVLSATVANRWFVARRGLVLGIFGAALSAGQLVFVPLLMSWSVTLGWRFSSIVLGGFALLIILPVALLMRNDPADLGLQPYGAAGKAAPPPSLLLASGGVMAKALRSADFWLLMATFGVCGATSNGLIGTHLLAHASEHGISEVVAASSIALMGAMNFIGTLASGWLTDKYDPRKLLCIYYGFRGLSLFMLPFVTEPVGLSFFAILFGLDYIATVPPTTTLIADTFGRKNVGTVYGWVFCSHQIGAALAAWGGGMARDSLGDYGVAFLAAGAIAITAALLSLQINHVSVRTEPAQA
jgi:sugar phosphate permease